MKKLTSLEWAVIQKLLDGENASLAKLRQQADTAQVLSREMTGVGFYTTLAVTPGLHRLDNRSFTFGDVIAEIPGVRNGAGFLLYVQNGLLHMVEGYTYGDESWPDRITTFQLRYQKPGERDLGALHLG
jgi:hypothetical protein